MTTKEFHDAVKRLVEDTKRLPYAERAAKASALLEQYATALDYGNERVVADLDTLSNLMQYDDLRSNNKRHDEYPVYTTSQLAHKERELGVQVALDDIANVAWVDRQHDDNVRMAEEIVYKRKQSTKKQREERHDGLTERIREAIQANPGASREALAAIVGVSRATLYRHMPKD